MLQSLLETTILETAGRSVAQGLLMGQIVQLTHEGRALVDFDGAAQPVEAASALGDSAVAGVNLVGLPVLLWIDPASNSPVILGIVRDRVVADRPASEKHSKRRTTKPEALQVQVDGERLVLEAKQQIELRCGESSITLRKDGKILIKGADLVSRASRSNRIKGASVEIN
jgi:hypothetical protein